eukprot:ctg_3227.g417
MSVVGSGVPSGSVFKIGVGVGGGDIGPTPCGNCSRVTFCVVSRAFSTCWEWTASSPGTVANNVNGTFTETPFEEVRTARYQDSQAAAAIPPKRRLVGKPIALEQLSATVTRFCEMDSADAAAICSALAAALHADSDDTDRNARADTVVSVDVGVGDGVLADAEVGVGVGVPVGVGVGVG